MDNKRIRIDETQQFHNKTVKYFQEKFDEETKSISLCIVFTDDTVLTINPYIDKEATFETNRNDLILKYEAGDTPFFNMNKYPASYVDLSYSEKRKILRQFDFNSKEAISIKYRLYNDFIKMLTTQYKIIINKFNLNLEYLFFAFITDGYLAFEKILNVNDVLLDLLPIDPATIVAQHDENHNIIGYEQTIGETKTFLENVIYISFESLDATSVIELVFRFGDIFDNENVYEFVSNKVINKFETEFFDEISASL